MKTKKTYIHYGNTKLDRSRFGSKISRRFTLGSKPDFGCLWASPMDDDSFTWKDWCDCEGFMKCDENNSFKFSLTDNAKVLNIYTENYIIHYIQRNPLFGNTFTAMFIDENEHIRTGICDSIDFQKILNDGYDGIELFNARSLHYTVFNSWDCDSIVVFNPDVIIEESED